MINMETPKWVKIVYDDGDGLTVEEGWVTDVRKRWEVIQRNLIRSTSWQWIDIDINGKTITPLGEFRCIFGDPS